MSDPAVLAVKDRVTLIADQKLVDPAAPRSARVEVVLKDGTSLQHFTPHAFGTRQNPMDTENVNAKTRQLMQPVLGAEKTEAVIERVNRLESLTKVDELVPFLTRQP
jgi:2-methylcitrate dehydratase PrpD